MSYIILCGNAKLPYLDKMGLLCDYCWFQTAANSGRRIATIRVSGKIRIRVCRDQQFMRFISIHIDHDSAYEEKGGEDV